jgi:hypothetical protein
MSVIYDISSQFYLGINTICTGFKWMLSGLHFALIGKILYRFGRQGSWNGAGWVGLVSSQYVSILSRKLLRRWSLRKLAVRHD